MERKRNRSTIYIARTSLHGCLLGLLSSHSLAQNNYGHISNIQVDLVHRGKGWMLCVHAVAVADGKNPLLARPDQGSPLFSLTKPVRLPSSLVHCCDVGTCRLPPPSSGTTSFTAGLHRNVGHPASGARVMHQSKVYSATETQHARTTSVIMTNEPSNHIDPAVSWMDEATITLC
jgi:hypothetical protein